MEPLNSINLGNEAMVYVSQQDIFVGDVELEHACLILPSLIVIDVGVVCRQALFRSGTKTSCGMEVVNRGG